MLCRFVTGCVEVLEENDIVELKHLNGVEVDGLVFDGKLSGGYANVLFYVVYMIALVCVRHTWYHQVCR